MATENILMNGVKKGGDRQQLHELLRILSMEAGKNVKIEGKENNLLELIAQREEFGLSREELKICWIRPAIREEAKDKWRSI